MTTPPTQPSGRPQRKRWREGAQPNSAAVTAATAGTTTVEVIAPGVGAARLGETGKKVGVVAPQPPRGGSGGGACYGIPLGA